MEGGKQERNYGQADGRVRRHRQRDGWIDGGRAGETKGARERGSEGARERAK